MLSGTILVLDFSVLIQFTTNNGLPLDWLVSLLVIK